MVVFPFQRQLMMHRATGLLLENAGIAVADAERGEVTHMPRIPFVSPRSDVQPGASQPPASMP